MRRKIFTVEDNFYLGGRDGTVVVGRLEKESPSIKPGDRVRLLRPDGKEISSVVGGIELPKFLNLEARLKFRNKVGVWFKSLTKEDLPTGTVVLLGD